MTLTPGSQLLSFSASAMASLTPSLEVHQPEQLCQGTMSPEMEIRMIVANKSLAEACASELQHISLRVYVEWALEMCKLEKRIYIKTAAVKSISRTLQIDRALSDGRTSTKSQSFFSI